MNLKELYQAQKELLLRYYYHLDLSEYISFGTEIEYIDNENCPPYQSFIYSILKANCGWMGYVDGFCAEIISPILKDNEISWQQLYIICKTLQQSGAIITEECGAHIHFGAQALGLSHEFWLKFIKLWAVYEDVIYYFCYGKEKTFRENGWNCAYPISNHLIENLESLKKTSAIWQNITASKKIDALNTSNVSSPYQKEGNTIEIRVPNGTIDPILWQKNILFFARLFEYVKSPLYDEELINRSIEKLKIKPLLCNDYENMNFAKAIELGNLVFHNEEELLTFLKIYSKGFLTESKKELIYVSHPFSH